jgi:class 3 adenylate cyclase
METNIAIMMADLSGYTALTEIHGAERAADMVDRYLELVNKSLVGDSRLHERAGDQVVIVSSSAEQLAYTATFLFERVHEQESFLALHAGLHYGPVIQKGNAYFGSAMNTASRIMSAAEKGKILCSKEFLEQLPVSHAFVTSNKGWHQFKNLLHPVDLFELHCCIRNISRTYVIDPVCHMLITTPKKAVQLEHKGTAYYFCSEKCRDMYITHHLA